MEDKFSGYINNAPSSFIYSNLLTVNKGEFMHSASEAAQSTIISPYVRGVETETFLILSKISEEKSFLKLYWKNIMQKILKILKK